MPGNFPTAIDGAMGVMEFEQNLSYKAAATANMRSEAAARQQEMAQNLAMAPFKTKEYMARAQFETARATQIEAQVAMQKRVAEALAKWAQAKHSQENQSSDITSADLSKSQWELVDVLRGAGDLAGTEKAIQGAARIDTAAASVRNADTRERLAALDERYKLHQMDATDYRDKLNAERTNAYIRNLGNVAQYRGANLDLNIKKYNAMLDQREWTRKERGMMDESLLGYRQHSEAHQDHIEQMQKDKNVQMYQHMHKTEAQRQEEIAIQQGRLAKGKIAKPPELLPGERYLKDSTDFISSKYKDLSPAEARMLGADLASRAQVIAKAHQGISWRDAMGQAYVDMAKGGAFQNMKAYANGRSPETGLPLPVTKEQLKAGTWYNSQHGPVYWDGKQGLTPDEYKLQQIRGALDQMDQQDDSSEDDALIFGDE